MRNAGQGLVLALVLFVAAPVFGEPVADLERKLPGSTGAERLVLLAQLAEEYRLQSAESSRRYAEEALALARKLSDRKGQAAALRASFPETTRWPSSSLARRSRSPRPLATSGPLPRHSRMSVSFSGCLARRRRRSTP